MGLRQILPFVGAAVGGYYGGAQGFQIGWGVGSIAGNVLDPKVIQGPHLGDIAQQTSQEGVARPILFGTSPPIAGNIIATSPPQIVTSKERQGKGGPKIETQTVYRTYAVRVCEGPISAFVRVWRNSKLVYDATENSLLAGKDNQSFLESARFFYGSYTQNASPDLEAVFGVGTTCAHRGTAYMVMANENLDDMAGAIPQWQFQVSTSQTSELIAFRSVGGLVRSLDGGLTWSVQSTGGLSVSIRQAAYSQEQGRIVGWASDAHPLWYSDDKGYTWTAVPSPPATSGYSTGGIHWSSRLGLWICPANGGSSSTKIAAYSSDGLAWNFTATAAASLNSFCGMVETDGQLIAYFGNTARTSANGTSWGSSLSVTPSTLMLPMQISRIPESSRILFASGNQTNRYALEASPQATFNVIGMSSFRASVDYSQLLGIAATDAFVPFYSHSGVEWGTTGVNQSGSTQHTLWSPLANRFINAGYASGPSARIYTSDDGISWTGRLLTGNYEVNFVLELGLRAADSGVSLPDIVSAICARADLDAARINVADLDAATFVQGLVITNAYPAAQGLLALGQVFLFDQSNFDGKIQFVPRGGNTVATITEDEMVDDDSTIQQAKRSDGIAIPRVLNLNYYDIDNGGLASAKQTSTRGGDRRAVGDLSLDTPVVMNATLAARTVDIQHKVLIEQAKGELKFSLPDSQIGLAPADPIVVQWDSKSERAMISQINLQDGFQEYTCLRDRQSAYVSVVEGIPPPLPSAPISSVPGTTLIEVLDTHILRDADDNAGLGYYVAVSGATAAWSGAAVELSYDAGANYVDAASSNGGAIMGALVTALPDHPQDVPDITNTITVQLNSYGAALLDSGLAGMMNRANLAIIGNEIVNFATADDLGNGQWSLSYFLRGRKGTEPQLHAIGERFVILDRGTLSFIAASVADIGRTMTFRATSFGTSTDTGAVTSMTYVGQSQIERQPAYLVATRDVTDLDVSWQGVGRLGGGGSVAQGARFIGYRVEFDDGVNPIISVDTSDQALTRDVSGLSSPVTVRVFQLNSLTGEGPAAEVIVA